MTPLDVYMLLKASSAAFACDTFDAHVLASIVAAGVAEVEPGGSLAEALGIAGKELRDNLDRYFPGALFALEGFDLDHEITIDDDEQCLRKLLLRSRSTPAPLTTLLAGMVARRATRPNHLWQDLGLANRGELSRLMQNHFAPLARRNTQDMKWKKFFYRMICRDESYRMCSAPSCSECCDFHACFGDESGESLLARIRLQLEAPGSIPDVSLNSL
jgi:nitrogen fixation protein NifQ